MSNRDKLSLWSWLKRLLSGKPHFAIGGWKNPYLLRWYLLPRNRFLNIYLHKFLRDDDDRALHDHPWWFVSLMLLGGYYEHVGGGRPIERGMGNIAFRSAEHRHRVQLFRDLATGDLVPCWTLVVTGPNKRVWGFWCPKGFVPWFDFVDSADTGNIGKGCE